MNILRVADSVSTLFPRKVRITLIDAESGNTITNQTVDSALLPEVFNRPTILEIENNQWRVLKVETINAGSYFRSSKMLLHVIGADTFKYTDKFTFPTSASMDEINTAERNTLFNDFTLAIMPQNWLQLEFLPFDSVLHIQDAITEIENIINSPDANNHLWGYESCYTRHNVARHQLAISFDEFHSFVQAPAKGDLQLSNGSYIKGGFALQSDSYTYYGIVDNGTILKLAIQSFDCADNEFADVLTKYNLIFIDWCNASILS